MTTSDLLERFDKWLERAKPGWSLPLDYDEVKALGAALSAHDNEVVALRNEVNRLKRGEFVCRECGIRKDGESDDRADF